MWEFSQILTSSLFLLLIKFLMNVSWSYWRIWLLSTVSLTKTKMCHRATPMLQLRPNLFRKRPHHRRLTKSDQVSIFLLHWGSGVFRESATPALLGRGKKATLLQTEKHWRGNKRKEGPRKELERRRANSWWRNLKPIMCCFFLFLILFFPFDAKVRKKT